MEAEQPEPAQEEVNPYAIPRTSARQLAQKRRPKRGGVEPASRGLRFGGYLLDSILPVGFSFVWLAMAAPSISTGGRGAAVEGVSLAGVFGLLLTLVYAAITFYLVAVRGQTLGKLLVGVQIAIPDGRRASFVRIFFLRGVVYLVIMMILSILPLGPGLFFLIDSLFIFRDDHRCLHDHIAGTIVVPYRAD